jgi:hypothetical protein
MMSALLLFGSKKCHDKNGLQIHFLVEKLEASI